jgi:hypothetical protein
MKNLALLFLQTPFVSWSAKNYVGFFLQIFLFLLALWFISKLAEYPPPDDPSKENR